MSEWIPSRPIVGFTADGSPVTVDSWNDLPKARLRLTDAEREAVSGLCEFAEGHLGDDDPSVVAVRGLLERLK